MSAAGWLELKRREEATADTTADEGQIGGGGICFGPVPKSLLAPIKDISWLAAGWRPVNIECKWDIASWERKKERKKERKEYLSLSTRSPHLLVVCVYRRLRREGE